MDSLTLVLPYSAYSGQNDKFWNVIEWPARTKREEKKKETSFHYGIDVEPTLD